LEADGTESLYDLERDPAAYHDLSVDPAYASVLADHRHELLCRLLERERYIPRTWAY
jgi:hypothetical protein